MVVAWCESASMKNENECGLTSSAYFIVYGHCTVKFHVVGLIGSMTKFSFILVPWFTNHGLATQAGIRSRSRLHITRSSVENKMPFWSAGVRLSCREDVPILVSEALPGNDFGFGHCENADAVLRRSPAPAVLFLGEEG
jgi:hypothetical protein